jgi:hypothetical protein
MKASEFVNTFASQGLRAWEARAFDDIVQGDAPLIRFHDVAVESKDGRHRGVFQAAEDYLMVGEPGDTMRMPFTPGTAQKIADFFGGLLPTSKMVDAIWRAAPTKLEPHPMVPNRGANLAQFLEHSRVVDEQISSEDANLTAGQKKDVIIAKNMPPGKVVIYGWHRPDGTHIQPRSSIHAANYIDYSHGIRLIGPIMVVDGTPMRVADVLRNPELASMLSDEGPIINPRYGTAPKASIRGFEIVLAWGRDLISGRSA